jgi:hypothetical protein
MVEKGHLNWWRLIVDEKNDITSMINKIKRWDKFDENCKKDNLKK